MSSDRYVAERIAWYLNGTLEESERSEVERLLAASEENREELREAMEAARIYGHRLPARVLVDYAFDGSHEEIPSELIERHLAASPLARAEYEMVRESQKTLERETGSEESPARVPQFSRPIASGWRRLALAASLIGLTALGMAGWQWNRLAEQGDRLAEVESRLREALAEEPASMEAPDEVVPEAPADPALERRLGELELENSQLAAGKSDLVEQVARQDDEIRQLGEQVAEFASPQANLAVVDLYPGDMVLRGQPQSERVVTIPRQTRNVALILNSGIAAEEPLTGMRILDESDEVIWTSDERPERDDLGTFTVSLPVGRLSAGRYTVELIDEAGGELSVLESYLVEIR